MYSHIVKSVMTQGIDVKIGKAQRFQSCFIDVESISYLWKTS